MGDHCANGDKTEMTDKEQEEEQAIPAPELFPSIIGLKSYWDRTFEEETINFKSDHLEGEIWFGQTIQYKMLRAIKQHEVIGRFDSIIDIGCGNGRFLAHLGHNGYHILDGIDVSEEAEKVCNLMWTKEGLHKIVFEVLDMLEPIPDRLLKSYKLAIDKGTYDTISLIPDRDLKSTRELYISNVHSLVMENGYLLLASCNWTKEELADHYRPWFKTIEAIPTANISFGGKVGNTVSILLLQKVPNLSTESILADGSVKEVEESDKVKKVEEFRKSRKLSIPCNENGGGDKVSTHQSRSPRTPTSEVRAWTKGPKNYSPEDSS